MGKTQKTEDSDDRPEFFFIHFANNSSQQLKIPVEFASKFLRNAPQNFILEGPNERCWQISAKKEDQSVCFGEGWPTFVEENSLEDGDFLNFSYNGASNFYVKIFGSHACRKDVKLTMGSTITPKTPQPRKDGGGRGGGGKFGRTGMSGATTGRNLRARDQKGEFMRRLMTGKRTAQAKDHGKKESRSNGVRLSLTRRNLRPRNDIGKVGSSTK